MSFLVVNMNTPRKRIQLDTDMAFFKSKSPAYKLLIEYIEKFCIIVSGQLETSGCTDPTIIGVVDLLDRIEELTESIPALVQPMRFGNKAFRAFHGSLSNNCESLLIKAGVVDEEVRNQITPYLLDSFGNPTRIDYGTGHEIAFLAFLICLIEANITACNSSVPLIIFPKYIQLVRKIITKYTMEPAGSHGVWGLDDYHHLPFLFGAAQLIGHEETIYRPCDILSRISPNKSVPPHEMFEYCVTHIVKTKCVHAPFGEVSPVLFDLLKRLDSWTLVCYGLMQMYKTEVLHKKPVMQHFYFSQYLRWE
jgi:serine/threonine-protein phosphatase 2A activator